MSQLTQRTEVGIIALVLLVAAGALAIWPLANPTTHDSVQGACLRVGLIMAAIWLALPELSALPRWLLVLFILSAGAIAFRPKYAMFILPLLVAYVVLRPRGSGRTTRRM